MVSAGDDVVSASELASLASVEPPSDGSLVDFVALAVVLPAPTGLEAEVVVVVESPEPVESSSPPVPSSTGTLLPLPPSQVGQHRSQVADSFPWFPQNL